MGKARDGRTSAYPLPPEGGEVASPEGETERGKPDVPNVSLSEIRVSL